MLVGVGLAVGLCFELLVPLQLYFFDWKRRWDRFHLALL